MPNREILCGNCDVSVPEYDTYAVDDQQLCHECYEDSTWYCEHCDARHLGGDRCPDQGERLPIQRYDFNPTEMPFFRVEGESDDLQKLEFVGVELEVAYGLQRTPRQAERRLLELFPSLEDCYYKHDGSIANGTQGEGVEFVSYPGTWAWWRLPETRALWDERLRLLASNGFRSYDAGSCGLHIHVSRAGFTATDLVRLQTLVYDNRTLFQRLSQRTDFGYCTFDGEDATTWNYRVRKAGYSRYRRRYLYFNYNPSGNAHRRVAINLPEDTPTVEFRFFRGTLHQPSFWKALECVHACVQYVRSTATAEQTDARFLRWVYDRERRYPHLTQFLDRWYADYRRGTRPRGKQSPTFDFPDTPVPGQTNRRSVGV